jgi:flagellar hook-length control protein FliK
MPAVELSRREEAAGALSGTSTARVVEAARTAAGQGGVEVQVRLHPEALGDVRVTVRWDGGVLSASLDVNTLAARDALQGSLQSLRATLHEQGVPVERLDVNLRMDLNGGARERESGRQTGPSAWMPPDLVVPEHDNATAAPSRSGRLDVRI